MNDDINNKKKRKRLDQIVIEIEEKEANFDKLIEEHKKILELTQREYTNTVRDAETKLKKSKKDIILEAGKYLENNLEIVKNNSPDQICRMLKQKFKGIINPSTIWFYSPDKWKSAGKSDAGRRGASVTNSRFAGIPANSEEEEEPLTEYEKQYVKVHDDKVHHNEHMEALIDYYLGLTEQEKTDIISKITKGSDYQKALIERARDNMLRIAKRLNDADIGPNLNDIGFLGKIHAAYTEIVYNELQLRKRNKEITGQ
jgi:hypothetical protein